MYYLEKQLNKRGYDSVVFSYPSVGASMRENVERLRHFIDAQQGVTRHFVGHSLGGLLIRLVYEKTPSVFTGRIVTLGTPHNGSQVAQRVAKHLHVGLLGGAYEKALDGDLPEWQGRVDLGSIAGNKCFGIDSIIRSLDKPNDGTVAVAETRLKNQTDSIELPLNHTALVYSKRVVHQVDHFLKFGHFAT